MQPGLGLRKHSKPDSDGKSDMWISTVSGIVFDPILRAGHLNLHASYTPTTDNCIVPHMTVQKLVEGRGQQAVLLTDTATLARQTQHKDPYHHEVTHVPASANGGRRFDPWWPSCFCRCPSSPEKSLAFATAWWHFRTHECDPLVAYFKRSGSKNNDRACDDRFVQLRWSAGPLAWVVVGQNRFLYLTLEMRWRSITPLAPPYAEVRDSLVSAASRSKLAKNVKRGASDFSSLCRLGDWTTQVTISITAANTLSKYTALMSEEATSNEDLAPGFAP